MQEMLLRLLVLSGTGAAAWLLIWLSRRSIEKRRRLALASAPLLAEQSAVSGGEHPGIRILAFKTANCRQCHQLQEPALRRVVEARREAVTIVEVDATSEHELVQAYHILTVPSTVILDAIGQPRAINYGFANTQRLLEQVDEVL